MHPRQKSNKVSKSAQTRSMAETIVVNTKKLLMYRMLSVSEIVKPMKSANLFGDSSHIFFFRFNFLKISLASIKNGLNSCFLRALAEKSNSNINAKIGNFVISSNMVIKKTCADIVRTIFESMLLRETGQTLGIWFPSVQKYLCNRSIILFKIK